MQQDRAGTSENNGIRDALGRAGLVTEDQPDAITRTKSTTNNIHTTGNKPVYPQANHGQGPRVLN